MTQQLRASAPLAENMGVIPSTFMIAHECNSASEDSNNFYSGFCEHSLLDRHTCRQILIHNKYLIKKRKSSYYTMIILFRRGKCEVNE